MTMTALDMKILLVEDEEYLLNMVSNKLSQKFTVYAALNGENAWHILNKEVINCIVLDIEMPVMSGIELIKKIRKNGFQTPVIVTTGRSCLLYAEECAHLGVTGYLTKPYGITVLMNKINEVLFLYDKMRDEVQSLPSLMHPKVQKALIYVERYYRNVMSVANLGKKLKISSDHLNKLFKKEVGVTFNQHLTRFRIEKAKELLKETVIPISEIIESTGFKTNQNFFRQFKKLTNVTPIEYRMKRNSPK